MAIRKLKDGRVVLTVKYDGDNWTFTFLPAAYTKMKDAYVVSMETNDGKFKFPSKDSANSVFWDTQMAKIKKARQE